MTVEQTHNGADPSQRLISRLRTLCEANGVAQRFDQRAKQRGRDRVGRQNQNHRRLVWSYRFLEWLQDVELTAASTAPHRLDDDLKAEEIRSRMMAFDRTPSPPSLEPKTVEALRAAFSKSVATGNHSDELHHLLCTAAREARDKGIHAEQLLVVMKEMWLSQPSVVAAPNVGTANTLLQELISRCIREYYAL